MFFDQSEIIDLLNCENCFQQYDEYYPPRMMPCCGKTICNTCIEKTNNQLNENKFKCIVCKKEQPMSIDGFIVNQLAVKLIERKPKEISRGPEANKLKQNICDLENLVSKLKFEMDNGDYVITEDCRELRRQVQLAKEQKIQEFEKRCDALFLKIDDYEEKCKSKYKEMNASKQKANELIKSVNDSIQKQNVYLRQLTVDDQEIIKCNQKIDEFKSMIVGMKKNIKKSILGNQIMKFEANTALISEEHLGKLTLCTFDFTVIIQIYILNTYLLK